MLEKDSALVVGFFVNLSGRVKILFVTFDHFSSITLKLSLTSWFLTVALYLPLF